MPEAFVPALRVSGASRAIEVLGDAWVLRILRTSFRGARRFSDHMHALGVSRAVLSDRLERMCRDGLLEKIVAPSAHPEYRLTETGLALWSVLLAMWQWEQHWGTGTDTSAPSHDRPRIRLIHLECGKPIDPIYACAHCQAPVTPFDTFAAPATEEDEHTAPAALLPARRRYRKSHSDDRGSLPTLLRLFGDRWNAMIVAAALQGHKTFSALSVATGIWPASLTDRLEELQSMGMLRGISYAGSRLEYHLTRAAIATYPITIELIQWGDHWQRHSASSLTVIHRPCGQSLRGQWMCPHCNNVLQRDTIRFD
ncbi:winged helix-turn-helix transcriptional regulator [Hydrogenophaga defluvii]|uniref:Winged helix-turn-helix transcriptional regulator n=1 Tax=Hydrogenophaga defluvii TaxID=249410 RepID=A0ABW2SGN2_9BURK